MKIEIKNNIKHTKEMSLRNFLEEHKIDYSNALYNQNDETYISYNIVQNIFKVKGKEDIKKTQPDRYIIINDELYIDIILFVKLVGSKKNMESVKFFVNFIVDTNDIYETKEQTENVLEKYGYTNSFYILRSIKTIANSDKYSWEIVKNLPIVSFNYNGDHSNDYFIYSDLIKNKLIKPIENVSMIFHKELDETLVDKIDSALRMCNYRTDIQSMQTLLNAML